MHERNFISPGRSSAIGENGMAATSHPEATLAAIEVLKSGGNAMDAALAAVAVQTVVEPAMTGIGGDCFAIVAPGNGGPITTYNASGWAPAAIDADSLRASSALIGETTAHAVTVPGAIDGWCHLNSAFGTRPLADLLRPAIRLAREGFRVTGRVAFDWARHQKRLHVSAAARDHYLPNGKPPRTGDRFAMPALASTFEAIGRKGRAAFYEGEVAEELVALLRAAGGAHTLDDFAAYSGFVAPPISGRFRGHDLLECPPSGQGLAALVIARILDGFALGESDVSEAQRIHLLAEATKAAYRVRDLLIADRAHMTVPVETILSDAYIDRLRAVIRPDRATPAAHWDGPVHKDTVYLTVIDRDRNIVSFINSIFASFGSGHYAPKSGILLHNRGAGFTLATGHPNLVAGRKRPLHTLIPALLLKDGRPQMSFGVMGGQFQAAGHAHLLTHMLDRGYDPQRANEAPRSFAFGGTLTLEPAFSGRVAATLASMGHNVVITDDPIGGCQSIWLDHQRGILIGSSDHRKDGLALGY